MAGLRSHELVLGVSPSDKHQRMLARYRRAVSLDAARGRVVADIRSAVKIGAARRAADLLIVLRWLLAPEASLDSSPAVARPRRRTPSARRRRAIDPTPLAQESSKSGGEVVLLFDCGRRRR
ncbi:MAG: polysaccharide deacetylase [Methylocystis sp.]|uniref:polysaccharide deacetylase n=1 Tax=Methylocystis sp. TaxID=1911079 RepID=UPI00394F010A